MTRTPQPSPNIINTKRIPLPSNSREADEIVQALIEGRADEYQQDARKAA